MTNSTAFLSNLTASAPDDLIAKAVACPKPRVVIARAGAELPMQAAKDAVNAGLMVPIFTGEAEAIKKCADDLDWDISGFAVHETAGEAAAGLLAAELCGAGEADVLMKGHLHTDVFMKSALNRDAGLRTGQRLVHIFHMTAPDSNRALLISDAAVNVAPDLETRRAAITHSAAMLHALGVARPKIALLSATETPIPAVPSSVEAAELAKWAKDAVRDADVSGPLAMDLILSAAAAATKGLADDPVAGQADAIIVPDIVSGNAVFKTLAYTCGGCAAGVVMGAKVPILLTSRADPAPARMASVALASIMANA